MNELNRKMEEEEVEKWPVRAYRKGLNRFKDSVRPFPKVVLGFSEKDQRSSEVEGKGKERIQ